MKNIKVLFCTKQPIRGKINLNKCIREQVFNNGMGWCDGSYNYGLEKKIFEFNLRAVQFLEHLNERCERTL